MKLSFKFFVFFLALLTATLGVTSFFAGRAVNKGITEQMAARLSGSIAELGQPLKSAFAAGKEDAMLSVLQKLQRQSGALYISAIKPDGTILAHTNVLKTGEIAGPETLRVLKSGKTMLTRSSYNSEPALEIIAPFNWAGDISGEELLLRNGLSAAPVGTIKAALPLAPAITAEREIIADLFMAVFAVYLAGLAIVVLFLRVTLKQVRLLNEAMTGAYSTEAIKAVRVVSKDELGALAEAFNSMREKLFATSVSKDYLDSILEQMPDSLVISDLEGRIVKINKTAARISGHTLPALMGKNIRDILEEPAKAGKSVLEKLEETGAVTESDLWLLSAGGGKIPVLFSASYIRNKDGASREILSVFKDISQHKDAEYRLRDYVKEIEAVNSELDAFAHSVSHDLKEPLRSMEMMSNIILTDFGGTLNEDLRDLLGRIMHAAARGRSLIDDLLSYARISRIRSPHRPADTNELAFQAVKMLEHLAGDKKARINFVSKLPLLYCDPVKLRQVFYNLVANALKYSDKPEPVIEIGAQREGEYWSFFVRDNGIGIEPQYFGEIFKIFKRLHGRNEYGGGSGIGLAIVEKIIQEHRGVIKVESEKGKGSAFFFLLPAIKEGT